MQQPINAMAYVAFLRGINVGGNALIKMTRLKQAFEELGFKKVTTVLASGNVVFETAKAKELNDRIESMLAEEFNVRARVIIRSAAQIARLIQSNPFQPDQLTSETKLHATFLAQNTSSGAKFPLRIPSDNFQIFQVSPGEVLSAVDLSSNARTPELMQFLEKRFGKEVTTRTWATVEKIAQLQTT